jgi:hypothetical protein
MQQEQVVLHQVAPKARLRQIAGGQPKHELMPGIGIPRPFCGPNQERKERSHVGG